MKTIEVTVFGRVQGVGFRYFTYSIAINLHVTGFVRNQSDGTVQIIAQGAPTVLQKFIDQVKNNPSPVANITNVTVQDWNYPEHFNDFKIRN